MPRSRICGTIIPPLPQYAFMALCSVKAQGQLHLLPLTVTSSKITEHRAHLELIFVFRRSRVESQSEHRISLVLRWFPQFLQGNRWHCTLETGYDRFLAHFCQYFMRNQPIIRCCIMSAVEKVSLNRPTVNNSSPKFISSHHLLPCQIDEGVSKSFRTGCLQREQQMVQLSATKRSCIAILWVSVVSSANITLCVASQRMFIVVVVVDDDFVIDSVRKLLDTPSYVAF
jgi:hypothetical protein